MAKILITGPIFSRLTQIWSTNFFSWVLPLLDVTTYHCMQFQGKRMIQTQENGKKPYFGTDLGPLGPNSGRQVAAPKKARILTAPFLSSLSVNNKSSMTVVFLPLFSAQCYFFRWHLLPAEFSRMIAADFDISSFDEQKKLSCIAVFSLRVVLVKFTDSNYLRRLCLVFYTFARIFRT